ncbi:leucyl/phenylalanyl-tRNA--protein transferase [Fimbriiglobus ruber]
MNRRRPWVSPESAGPDGLVGVGGDLRPSTLVRGYAEGVFPWFNEGDPILWWSPDPRAVIELDGIHISHSLARTIRSGRFRVTANCAFGDVIRGCADCRTDGTWVTRQMIEAYEELHRLGHAHSVETWVRTESKGTEQKSDSLEGWTLAGGIYGVSVGGLFAGESMFFRVSDGSKVALAALVERLKTCGFELFDVQMRTEHTTRMGATDIPRKDYLRRLREAVKKTNVRFA